MKKFKKNKSLLDDSIINSNVILETNNIQKKVANIGFEYSKDEEAINKIIEEAIELKKELKNKNSLKIKEELGDLIFSTFDVARKLNLNPEEILKKSNKKFINRWKKLEFIIIKEKKDIKKLNLNQLDRYWNLAKKI